MGGTGPALLSSCRFPSRLAAWGRVCWFGLLVWVFGLGFRPGFLAWVLGVAVAWFSFRDFLAGFFRRIGGVFRYFQAAWMQELGSALHRGLGFIKVDFVPVNAVELGESSGDLCGVSPFQAVAPRSV